MKDRAKMNIEYKIEELVKQESYSFEDVVDIVRILRSENGCPWDKEQTNDSIKYDTIEEAYEVLEAINEKDDSNLVEELGDVLLHILLHSQIGEDEGRFVYEDVIQGIAKKLIRRHPHVFLTKNQLSTEKVLEKWDDIKKEEKQYKSHTEGLHGIAKALPALTRANKVQKKVAKVGFDFQNIEDMIGKLEEEVEELKEGIRKNDTQNIEEEIGDIFFSTVNIARFFELNPEKTLTNAVKKFINRFEDIEHLASQQGTSLDELSLDEMDILWEKVKSNQVSQNQNQNSEEERT